MRKQKPKFYSKVFLSFMKLIFVTIDQLLLYKTQTLVSSVSVLFVEQIPRHTWRFVAGHRCRSSRSGHSSCTACHPLPGPSHFRGESLWVSWSTNQEPVWCGYTFISVLESSWHPCWWSKAPCLTLPVGVRLVYTLENEHLSRLSRLLVSKLWYGYTSVYFLVLLVKNLNIPNCCQL